MKNHLVLLIGGSSGTGKSYLARQLAEHYKMPLTEVDDIRIALQQVVNKEEHPDLFTFVNDPDLYIKYDEQQFVEKLLNVGKVVWKSLDVLISKHIACNEPVIFEGDSIIPELLSKSDMQNVRTVLIYDEMHEIMERQTKRNRDAKDLERSEKNAFFSYAYGQELKRQAEGSDCVVIQASPIETLFERTLKALEE